MPIDLEYRDMLERTLQRWEDKRANPTYSASARAQFQEWAFGAYMVLAALEEYDLANRAWNLTLETEEHNHA